MSAILKYHKIGYHVYADDTGIITIVVYRHIGVYATPQWGEICLTPPLTQL